jgi:glycosyltransferase involved in cell wall biosynthesis
VTNIDDPRVRYIDYQYKRKPYPASTKNAWLAGEVLAANEGLRKVRGPWIARLDDDEEWTDSHISDLLQYATAENVEFVSGNVEQERNGRREIVTGGQLFSEYLGTINSLKNNTKNPRVGGHSTWLYRSYLRVLKYNKNCWRKKTNQVNDIDLVVRFMKAGVTVGHLNKVVTIQRPRPGEATVGWAAHSRDM